MKTSNPITATLLFISFAVPAALVSPESFAQAAAIGTAGIAYGVAFGAIAYALAALAYGLVFGLAVAVAGIAELAKRAGSNE